LRHGFFRHKPTKIRHKRDKNQVKIKHKSEHKPKKKAADQNELSAACLWGWFISFLFGSFLLF